MLVVMPTTFTEGYTMYYVAQKTKHPYMEQLQALRLDMMRRMANKYLYDSIHSTRIEGYCNVLFEALYKFIGLRYEAKYLLQMAAIFHETGKFINIRKHNLCTYNLIGETDIFGLADDEAMNDGFWDELLKVRGEVNKVIEQARADKKVGGSLEAAVTLYADAELAAKLNALGDELRFVLLTSGANVADYASAPADAQQSELLKGLKVALSKAEGEKCPRCWHYTTDIGKVAEHAEICGRCVSNVAGDGEQRKFA